MAIEHLVVGPCIVTFNEVQLGYTRDGVRVEFSPRFIEVHSDDFGGEQGAPADKQIVGATATITCELTKFENTEVRKLTSYEVNGTAGTLPVLGTLLRQDSETATLLIDGANEDWTFATAHVVGSQDVNLGTKFSTWMVRFEAWINNTTSRQILSIS